MAPSLNRKLRLVPDIAEAAAELFLEIKPRTLVLAGGHTPRPVYRRLALIPYNWDGVHVFFSDERCVPPEHPDSNFGMAHETLLAHVEAQVHRMRGETCDPAIYEEELRAFFGPSSRPAFDLAFLGLGTDGHTASLFPQDAALAEKVRWVARVARPDYRRLTLTIPALSAAKTVIFLVAGPDKREALRRLLRNEDIPAARVSAARIVILADERAV